MDPITIVIDVYPPADKKPGTVVIAATAEGGTPHFASGSFADRHALLDQAYGEAAKRAVKAEAKKDAKPKTAGKVKKSKPMPGHLSKSSVATVLERAAEADQLGPEETDHALSGALRRGRAGGGTQSPLVEAPAPAGLPVIDGDDGEQLEFKVEGSDG